MGGISKGTTEGFYKCTAKNRHGDEASAQTKIKVIGNYQLINCNNEDPMPFNNYSVFIIKYYHLIHID